MKGSATPQGSATIVVRDKDGNVKQVVEVPLKAKDNGSK